VPLFGASSADNLPRRSQRLGDNARNPNASSGPLSASSATRSAPVTPTTSAYLVAKYLEISACGSIVSGSIPGQGLLVWCDCGFLLGESMSDGENPWADRHHTRGQGRSRMIGYIRIFARSLCGPAARRPSGNCSGYAGRGYLTRASRNLPALALPFHTSSAVCPRNDSN
jgi:hypothetical protein